MKKNMKNPVVLVERFDEADLICTSMAVNPTTVNQDTKDNLIQGREGIWD